MDDGLDSQLDIGFVNYKKHPSNPTYMVFRFKDQNMINFFRSELQRQDIWFEEGEDTLKNGKDVVMFGVHKNDFKSAQKINQNAHAKYKKRFIADKPLRYALLGLLLFLIAFAIFGVIKVNFID